MPMPLPVGPLRAPAREQALRDIGGLVALVLLGGIVCNILLAIWIFTDIRKRGEGSGIFIALAAPLRHNLQKRKRAAPGIRWAAMPDASRRTAFRTANTRIF